MSDSRMRGPLSDVPETTLLDTGIATVRTAAVSARGRLAAIAGSHGHHHALTLWDGNTQTLLRHIDLPDQPISTSFSSAEDFVLLVTWNPSRLTAEVAEWSVFDSLDTRSLVFA